MEALVLGSSAHPVTWIEPGTASSVSMLPIGLPPGVPVAAVGVDNARNAAVLAARILNA